MKTLHFFILIITILSFGCGHKNVPLPEKAQLPAHSGEIRISGAYALMPLVSRWISEYQKIHPTVLFTINPSGSLDAIQNSMTDNSDLVMISSALTEGLDSTAWVVPVARLSVVMIANKKNPYWNLIVEKGIKKDDLIDLFSGEQIFWGEVFNESEKYPASVYVRADKAGSTEILSRFLWLDNHELKGEGVLGEDKMLEALKKNKLGLGYCNFIYTFDTATKEFDQNIGIIPLDINQNNRLDFKENFYNSFTELQRAMWLGKYPCVLNRQLQIVVSTKPATKELHDFLKWIFTDGQKTAKNMGYMELRSSEVKYCLAYLENEYRMY